MAASWPTECSANQYTTTSGWRLISRHAGCSHQGYGITVTHRPSGAVGTASLHFGMTAEAAPKRAQWDVTGYMALWVYTGLGRPSQILGELRPTGQGNTAATTSWNITSLTDSWQGDGIATAGSIAPKKSIKGVGAYWRITLMNPKWSNSVVIWSYDFTSRCDRFYEPAGCVFNTYPGYVKFPTATAPEYARHVSGAIKSGLPGRYKSQSYLHRLTNAALATKNRNKACPERLTRPKGRSCDEYPFASTKEGAYTSKASKARSQSWCRMKDPARTGSKGWSRCFINASHNSSGGGLLVKFYKAERILNNDRFQVAFS